MRKLILAAVAVAASIPAIASAQDMPTIQPYLGVMAGGETFDRQSDFGTGPKGAMHGLLLQGVGGINVPIGDTFFIGGEGFGAKGTKDIDWQYGAKGRAGLMAGSTGMIYLTAGHEWIKGRRGFANHDDWTYGGGVEVSPAALFGGPTTGPRLRIEVTTYQLQSIRPMAGMVFAF